MPGDAAPAPAKEAALNLGALAAGGGGGAGGVGGGGAGGEATAPSGGGGSAAGPSSGQAGGGAPGEGEDVRSGDDAREGALGGEGGGEPRGAPSGGAGAETLEADAAGPSIEAAPVLTRKRAPKELFIAKDGAAEDGSTDESEKKKRMLKLNRAAQIRYRARRKLKEQELKDGLSELQSAREELVHNKALVLSLTQRNAALGRALTTTLAENATLRTMVANLVPGIFGEQAATANVADPNQWLALGLGWAVPGQPQPQLAQQQQQSPQQQLQLLLGAQAAQPGGLGANQAEVPPANPLVQTTPYPLVQPAPARPPGAFNGAGGLLPTQGQGSSQLQPTLQPSLALTHYHTAATDARQTGRGRRGDGEDDRGQGDHGRPSR